jgi:hypothetical protein
VISLVEITKGKSSLVKALFDGHRNIGDTQENHIQVIPCGYAYLTKKPVSHIFTPSNHFHQQLYNPGVELCREYYVPH